MCVEVPHAEGRSQLAEADALKYELLSRGSGLSELAQACK